MLAQLCAPFLTPERRKTPCFYDFCKFLVILNVLTYMNYICQQSVELWVFLSCIFWVLNLRKNHPGKDGTLGKDIVQVRGQVACKEKEMSESPNCSQL